jgi:thiamine biosynthesis lipoprotein
MTGLTRRGFALGALAAAGTAAAAPPGRAVEAVWRGTALGGAATIRLRGEGDAARAALAEAAGEIARLEALFSLADPASQLSRLNRDGALDAPARDLRATLLAAEGWRAATWGAFEPTVQPLWRARFQGRDADAARASVGPGRVAVAPAAVRLAPGAAVTLNGIAQGTVADRVAALLARRGFADLVADAGELRLSGPRRPVDLPELGLRLRLAEGAVAVSRPGALRFLDGGGHILAPDGGAERWVAVAAVAPFAEDADALSTAAAVSGPDRLAALAERPGVALFARGRDGRTLRFGARPLLREIAP